MCGIGGILRITPPGEAARAALERTPFDAVPEAWLDALDASIRHRGPDGQGRFRDRAVRADGSVLDVALVHRRLSIIDHGGGAQPMVSQREGISRAPSVSEGVADASFRPLIFHGKPNDPVHYQQLPDIADTLAVVFNGCIYNHRELRAQLQAAGHKFQTDHSDTEVLLHGQREWYLELAPRLDGMFSAAVWDRGRGGLTLRRDSFGEKPLYCTWPARDLVFFSSSAAGLLALLSQTGGGEPKPDLVQPWVRFGWNQLPPIASIREVQPGESVEVGSGAGTCVTQGWWLDAMNPSLDELTEDQVDDALERAVQTRLEADVSLGAFLSGGVDSALVCAYARRARPDLTAFSVRMPERAFDEADAAAETARELGIRHQILECDARPGDDLVSAITQLGLPFGDSSLLPSTWVSRAAKTQLSVALAGDGGDEMFMGYERHRVIRTMGRLSGMPRSVLRGIGNAVPASSDPKSRRTKLSRLLLASASNGYKDLVAIFPPPMDARLNAAGGIHFGITPTTDDGQLVMNFARRFDLLFYLPFDLMRKSDTASMSVALEVRSPFLSKEVARMCVNARADSLMPRGQRKGLLRAVARRHLPVHVVDRPKMGFAIPIGEWFRTDYGGMRTLLLDHLNSTEPFGPPSLGIDLNMGFVRQMLDEHLGTGPSGLVKRDHSQRLYMLLVLSIWAKWLGSLGRSNP